MCEHKEFKSMVKVGRLSEKEGGVINSYCADITINCAECGQAFEFVGVSGGYSPFEPKVSADSTELRIPIKPSTGQLIFEDADIKLN